MICPKCKGEREIRIAFPHNPDKSTLPCHQCGGVGHIPVEMVQWMINGEILKSKRIDKRIILREASKQTGEDGIKLSEMERGVIEPDMSIYDCLEVE